MRNWLLGAAVTIGLMLALHFSGTFSKEFLASDPPVDNLQWIAH
ncbi:MAG: hypothetical protein NTW79_00610 [Candidatus Berkelbacteria bacterium]|nr:hypothetical protein [Candidatus Berkelbacteria bacterium]